MSAFNVGEQQLNIKFVGEVEKHPELYNYKLPGYSRKDITERAWQEVAAQVNLSGAECREKWRNLRTVFRRKMKPSQLEPGARKRAYYLETAMQFCLPFMNMSMTRVKRNWAMKKKPAVDADQCVAEYFKATIQASEAETSSNNIDRQMSLKMFLLSLLPELEELSDYQIKLFKRRVFCLIDEISTSSNHESEMTAFRPMLSPQSDSSHTSQMSATLDVSQTMHTTDSKDFFQDLQQSDVMVIKKE